MPDFTFEIFSNSIQKKVIRREIRKHQILFQQGERATSIYFVDSGCVRLVVFPQEDKQMVLYRARCGKPFAEEHLTRTSYSYSAIADVDSVVRELPMEDLLSDICQKPEVVKRYMTCLGGRYYQLRMNFERLGISSAKQRVLHFLITHREDASNQVNLTGKLKSLSDDLNLSHEAVYRALRDLESDGAIRRSDGTIDILI